MVLALCDGLRAHPAVGKVDLRGNASLTAACGEAHPNGCGLGKICMRVEGEKHGSPLHCLSRIDI